MAVGSLVTWSASDKQAPSHPVASRTIIKDAESWETVAEPRIAGIEYDQISSRFLAAKPSLSPDGHHLGVVRSVLDEAEIWSLPDEKLIVSAPGTQIVFSEDGSRAAIVHSGLLSLRTLSPSTISSSLEVSLWELPGGRFLSRFSLASGKGIEVRFSPDGRRLLTLNGKYFSDGIESTPPLGRLWDVDTGKEILSMPVAEQSHFDWEMLFDATGLRLTSLLFRKRYGSAGGVGRSLVYDATPLSSEDDARLISSRLVEMLVKKTPIPSELIAEVNSRTALRSGVRQASLAAVERLGTNGDQIADACLAILGNRAMFLGNPTNTTDAYRKALLWAETLYASESGSFRSRVLIGCSQYFCDQTETAVATLSAIPESTAAVTGGWEFLRKAFLLMALHRAGVPRDKLSLIANKDMEYRSTIEYRSLISFWVRMRIRELGLEIPDRSSDESDDRRLFKTYDKNDDGKLTESDSFWSSTSSWKAHKPFDQDNDDALNLDEYLIMKRVMRLSSTSSSENLDPVKLLANLNEALKLVPHYTTVLNRRAWLLATLPDEALRNGAQAVADATRSNELTEWKIASPLDTLAAAHAEAGNFEEAVKWEERAVDKASVNTHHLYRSRLEMYRQKKPYRETFKGNSSEDSLASTNSWNVQSAPLLPPDAVARFRRIPGWSAGWSPDSQKIVRNASERNLTTSNLEIVDLQSSKVTVLCQGGFDAAWSTAPEEKIAFVKFPNDQSRLLTAEQLWIVNPDGSELKQLTEGGFPHWTRDNKLVYRRLMEDKSPKLFAIDAMAPELPLWDHALDSAVHPAVSRDGSMIVRIVPGKLSIHRLATTEELVALPLSSPSELGLADFSPDGKFVVYGSRPSSSSQTQGRGIWLIEVASGHRRLLASGDGTLPRWSPDGQTISIDRRDEKEIVLLDVSQLDFSLGLEKTRPMQVKLSTEPVDPSNEREGQLVP